MFGDFTRRTAAQAKVHNMMGEWPRTYAMQLQRLYATNQFARHDIQRKVLFVPRTANIAARASQIIAEYVYGCPSTRAVQAWRALGTHRQDIVDNALQESLRALKEELCLLS